MPITGGAGESDYTEAEISSSPSRSAFFQVHLHRSWSPVPAKTFTQGLRVRPNLLRCARSSLQAIMCRGFAGYWVQLVIGRDDASAHRAICPLILDYAADTTRGPVRNVGSKACGFDGPGQGAWHAGQIGSAGPLSYSAMVRVSAITRFSRA